MPYDLQQSIEGKSFHETAVYFKERFNIPDELEKIKTDWNNMALEIYKTRVTLKEGALDFLKFLKENNIKTAIATSNSRVLTDIVLEALDISAYFDTVITACEVGKGKPSPDIYLTAAEKVGVSPDDCVVFEDITPGIMAGKNAGMTVFAVDDDFSKAYEEEKKALADYYIDNFYQVF